MRKLMWFTLGFGAACALCVYFPAIELPHEAAAISLTGSLLLLLLGRKYPKVCVAATLFLGCFGGLSWYQVYHDHYLKDAALLDGLTREVTVTASDYSFQTDYGRVVDGTIRIGERSHRVRAYLDEGEELPPGTNISGNFLFRLTTQDSLKGSTYHAGEGVFLLAYQKGEITLSDADEETVPVKISHLRRHISKTLREYLHQDCYPFAKALLLGDTSELSYAVDTHLKVSGIRHVAAVSGLHVSILFALVSMVTFRKRFLTALLGLPMLAVFAALAGFSPSVVRACLMSALMLLALVLNREYDGATALSFSVLVMLVGNPLAISSVSLQLSVASVAGIFLFSPSIAQWLTEKIGVIKGKSLKARLKRWIVSSVATSLSAMSLTTPLSALYFGTVSLIAVVTNLLTLWIISFVFYGLMGIYAVSFLSHSAASAIAFLTGWMIRYVLLTAKVLAGFPLACIYTVSEYVVLWLIFAYLLLAAFWISGKRKPKEFACCVSLGLCAALLCAWGEPMLYDTAITVVDVGQGQCILLQSEGKTYMVDCGGENDAAAADAAAECLLSQGIIRLDGLILTHLDRDHAGGAENLLSRVEADWIILPPVSNELDFAESLVIYADRNLEISWGSSKLRIFGEKISESNNENSLCVLLDTEKCDILITGDRNAEGELRLIQRETLQEVDVLIAGHHGAKDAVSQELLEAVKPETVCISAGTGNRYGHPAPQTLERLHSFGCEIYRTDVHGTITIRR